MIKLPKAAVQGHVRLSMEGCRKNCGAYIHPYIYFLLRQVGLRQPKGWWGGGGGGEGDLPET